ncbi:hypothetical protein MNBD_ALPHA12-601 [hydrothermal vent metagenome]|uniref:DUF2259 domain-containing protein n=1 Tax=hydrothermal vent metagenome TaxID=652676 RepID=A0A3B0TV13_9ZZZZ
MMVWGAKPAWAGNFAQPAIIGYSKDLRYFAYEEYGIEDASGFPYSSIYFIDLRDGSPVAGTPVRIRLDNQDDPLPGELVGARQLARQKAQIWLDKLKIGWPAEMLAYNGDGVPDLEGLSLRFGLTGYNGAVIGDYRLTLKMVDFNNILECEKWAPSKPQGFVLTITDYDFQKSEIYRDKSLPKSEKCPLYYKISGVFAPFQANDISNTVALISVYSSGWEGQDRRFIVVPVGQSLK